MATMAFTPFAKWLARRTDAIDYPDNRRVNTEPIPRMGGVAMLGGAIVGCILMAMGSKLWGWSTPIDFSPNPESSVNFPILAIGVIFMFLVGLYDDMHNLRAPIKFAGQLIACSIVAASGLLLSEIQDPFNDGQFIEFGWLAYPLTAIYLVCFANIINLIDGLDGLASGISAISAATIFSFSVFAGRYEAAVVCVVIMGICLGFLHSNRHPASIFMGDSGSLLLGLGLGIASLLAVARSTLIISLLVPILAAGVPIMDTAAAIIRRLRAHQRIDQPDAGHIHHRLLKAGFSQDSTVIIMWLWTGALSICSIVLAESDGLLRSAAILIAAAITGFAIHKLKLLDPILQHYYNPRQDHNNKEEQDRALGVESRQRRAENPARARYSTSTRAKKRASAGSIGAPRDTRRQGRRPQDGRVNANEHNSNRYR